MRAYAHARGRVIIGIFTILFLVVFITSKSRKSIHPLLEKNKPSFYGKQVLPGKVCKFSGQYQKEMLQKRVLQHLRCL